MTEKLFDYRNYEWNCLSSSFPWMKSMASTMQDLEYHEEGDVATHTRMVIEELLNIPEFYSLEEKSRETLFATAILHDVAKPMCTTTEDGRITSPKHSVRGEKLAQMILAEHDDRCQAEEVAKLVRYHGMPLWFYESKDPLKKVVKASLDSNNYMISLLAEADVLGRVCKQKKDLLERVKIFKDFCNEEKCLTQERSFETDHARFVYFYKEDSDINYVPFDTTKFRVTLMCGLPGSGKDTWIKKNWNGPVISLDAIRERYNLPSVGNQSKVISVAKALADKLMKEYRPFVWNATNISGRLRTELIEWFYSYDARTRIVFVNKPLSKTLVQNNKRQGTVPEPVIYEMLDKLDVPSKTECHELITDC